MRTVRTPITKTETLSGHVWTDEGDDLPIEIEIEYARLTDLFGDFCFQVTVFGWTVLGKTTTPKEIIQDQIEKIIKDKFCALSCEINYL
jgi:hypothetical protein